MHNTTVPVQPVRKVEEAPALGKAGRSVFVIEDDPEMFTLLERVLRGIDPTVEVDWALSAEEAIDQLVSRIRRRKNLLREAEPPYDLIVADIFLHGNKTGVDLWRTCTELFPRIPIVVTSGMSMEKFFRTLGDTAVSPPYLAKPFSIGECKDLFEAIFEYSNSNKGREDL